MRRAPGESISLLKTAALANTSLKTPEKCSFTPSKLRFFIRLRLVLAALATFFNRLPCQACCYFAMTRVSFPPALMLASSASISATDAVLDTGVTMVLGLPFWMQST